MKCANCGTDNATGDQFCIGCGNELTDAMPQPAAPQPDPNADTTTPAIATITYEGKNIPLYEGSKMIVAREDSDLCKPDLPIKGGSGTPVEITVDNGVITVHDTGTSIGTRVVVYLKPGDSMAVKPGDMLMLGQDVLSIG